jgi:hypothetical protein
LALPYQRDVPFLQHVFHVHDPVHWCCPRVHEDDDANAVSMNSNFFLYRDFPQFLAREVQVNDCDGYAPMTHYRHLLRVLVSRCVLEKDFAAQKPAYVERVY